MKPGLHVIGGGVAGLAAAVEGARRGYAVTLHEGARQAGGRCRTVTPSDDRGDTGTGFAHDNGTHVLLAANTRALRFLDRIGARGDWVEPEPSGLPVFNAATGTLRRVGLSPWSWLSPALRPEGLSLADLPRLAALALPLPDRSVADVIGRHRPVYESLVEPLTVAVLNTAGEVASARRLGRALWRIGAGPGRARLLVAGRGLGPDLVEPALRALAARGGQVRTGARLRGLARDGQRATALAFADGNLPLEPDDRVVLALPPGEVKRLLPDHPVPDRFEPIVNAHYRLSLSERPRFLGLRNALSQWVLVRSDHVSVTVSAAGPAAELDGEDLGALIWGEIAPGLRALGLAVPETQPEARVVKEKRATLRQAVGPLPLPPLRPLANLALAGDWLSPLPATIESAVRSGEDAVRRLQRPFRAAPVAAEANDAEMRRGASEPTR